MRKLPLILFIIIVLGPLAALVFDFAWPAVPSGKASRLIEGIPTDRQWNLLARTALFAVCVSAGTLIIGITAGK